MTVVEEERKKNGGLFPGTLFRVIPSRSPENALLGHFLKLLSRLISVPSRKSDPLTSNEDKNI